MINNNLLLIPSFILFVELKGRNLRQENIQDTVKYPLTVM